MTPVSDLVRDSKLKTTIQNDITRHVIVRAGHSARQRKLRQEQRWKRVRTLGEGSDGIVWLEKLIEGECLVEERAVKAIRKRIHKSKTIDISRELETIAKFSHPIVSLQNISYHSCEIL